MTPEIKSRSPRQPYRLFNTPLEYGFRTLFVLDAMAPGRADLQRLISYDYLLIHSGDVDGGPPSLHPAVPFRGSELLIKRELVRRGLNLMCARELVSKELTKQGMSFTSSPLTRSFIDLLQSEYSRQLASRARWLADRFTDISDEAMEDFMSVNVGRWGAEFDRLAALNELEL